LAVASPVTARNYRAIDGDTIVIGSEHLRVVGLDTPETKFAACAAERSQGLRAQRRLQELLNTGPVAISRQRVTRGPNKGELKRDKYKQTLGESATGMWRDPDRRAARSFLQRPRTAHRLVPTPGDTTVNSERATL
jgi:endonuclease YncB( thermonuclease family)